MWPFAEVTSIARRIGGGALVAALDDMEMWQIAAAFGLHDPEPDTPRDGRRAPVRSRRDLVAERMRHARGEGPEPVPDEPDPAVAAWAMEFAAQSGGLSGGGTPR